MTHPQAQDDEAKPGVVVSNEGMTFADVAEHYQENGGLVKLGVAPDDDEALVEVMAEAMAIHHVASWSSLADPFGCDPGTYDPLEKPWWRESARAALTALRNHEGRKG